MNDRFRFRAWNDKVGFIYFGPDYCNGCEWWDFPNAVKDKSWVVEQCTGLKDKTGELIYEGDIVVHEHQVKRLVPVEDKKTLERVQGIDKETGFPLVYRTKKIIKYKGIVRYDNLQGVIIDLPHSFHWWKGEENGVLPSVEVIGNIHENPEILEDKYYGRLEGRR